MLKKPPKIKHAYIDGDLALFPSASSASKIEYYFVDPDGNEVGTFDSAKAAKNWLFEVESMGADFYFEYSGDFSLLERRDRTHIGDFQDAVKTYEKLIKRWVKESGAESYTVYVSKKSGAPNFRHDVALRKPYKGNRKSAAKPHWLEELRKYVLTLPHHKKSTGSFETDDIVCGLSQRKASNVLIQNEKDSLQVVNCWVYYPDLHDEPVFSRGSLCGYVDDSKGKLTGLGHLFLLAQTINGDQADSYSGLDGCGLKGTVELLSPFNNQPKKTHLKLAVYAVCEAYYKKYGERYEYKNKNAEDAVGSWKDFLLESLNLAYMRKGRNDNVPQPYTDMINEWEKENL